MEFLEAIESIKAEEASVRRLFDGESGVRGLAASQRQRNPRYLALLGEAVAFVADVYEGRRPVRMLQEALSTSDFPLLFGDIIDRQLLGNYMETPQTYRAYCRVATVSDFRTVNRFAINGSEAVLAQVPQQTEYPESKLADVRYQYSVAKYGRVIPFAWETMVNDDLDALKDIPARFGRAARRTEEKFATQQFVDASGPHASLYTAGNKNIVNTTNGASATNPALSISALQDALIVLSKQTDADGEPIAVDTVHLVIPPALQVTAENILNATELWLGGDGQSGAGGVGAQALHVANWMRNRTKLSVNYYIPIVASSANGSTSWFLFANPSSGRPAVEVGFLRGHETPEVFIKSPNATRVGGGAADPMNGDFDTDSIMYKVRHVLGGTYMDGKMTVASNGSGS